MKIYVSNEITSYNKCLLYIKNYIEENVGDGPVKSYYLQCADWVKSYYHGTCDDDAWIPTCDLDPLYSLDDGDIIYADETFVRSLSIMAVCLLIIFFP